MERFVARSNIEHYRALLKSLTDPAERRKIEILLAEEKQKLDAAEAEARTRKKPVRTS